MSTLPTPPAALRRSPRFRWLNLTAALLALFLVVAGARLWLVQTYITPLPYSDPWDGEAANLLKPWVEGHYQYRSLFDPHNEHRIVPTRLLCLAIFAANGQWDAQLEAAVNAALWAVFVTLLAGVLIRVYGVGWRWTILAVAVYGTLPFGWENTLIGFASQNYFLIIFSLLAIWGLGLHRAGTAAWWAGLGGALLACVSMASGFVAAAVVLGLLILRAGDERALPGWGGWLTGVISAGLIAAGWLTCTVVPGHAALRAESAAAWGEAFCRSLAWPFYLHPFFALLLAAPFLLLAAVHLRQMAAGRQPRNGPRQPERELLLGVCAWCLLQMAAIAYARGAHGAAPAPRYMDCLALFPLTNLLAAALLATRSSLSRGRRIAAMTATALWLSTLAVGLWQETRTDFQVWLPWYADCQQRSEGNVSGYVNTGDFEQYLAGKSFPDIPYPAVARMKLLLDDPTIRGFLPANVRVPLRLQWADQPGELAFVPDGFPFSMSSLRALPCWGSYPARQGTARGLLLPEPPSSAGLPYLQFQFAGDLGEAGTSFILRDAASQRQVAWHPAHVAHERWRIDYIRPPGDKLLLEANNSDARKWFAFTAPVSVGWWSYWAGYVLRRSGIILAAGLALALLALVNGLLEFRRARGDRASGPALLEGGLMRQNDE